MPTPSVSSLLKALSTPRDKLRKFSLVPAGPMLKIVPSRNKIYRGINRVFAVFRLFLYRSTDVCASLDGLSPAAVNFFRGHRKKF